MVGGYDLSDLIITASKLAGSSVTAEKIANLAVGNAAIANLAVTNAKIADLAVDNAKIANLSATKLTAGSLAVDSYIQSSGYVAGLNGWKIDGVGNAEFQNVTMRGTMYAFAGTIGGATINATSMRSTNYMPGTAGWLLLANGDVELNNAVLRGDMRSDNYVPGTSGWRIDSASGTAEFNELMANTQVTIGAMNSAMNGGVSTGGRVELQANKIMVYDSTGVLRVKLGYLL